MNNAVASADACNMTGASSGFAQASAFGMPTYVACYGIGPEGSSGQVLLVDTTGTYLAGKQANLGRKSTCHCCLSWFIGFHIVIDLYRLPRLV